MAKNVVVVTDNYQHLRKVNVLTAAVAGTSLPSWASIADDGRNTFETVCAVASPVAGLATVIIPDVTAPTITSANSASVAENATLAHALTANETVTWSVAGGADAARFEISGSTLRWLSNGTKDFEAPNDANTDNAYVVSVRATDASSNTTDQTVTVTVTDVDDTAPTITSAATANNAENSVLAHALTANETVTWSIVGGADAARFELSGSTLRWASNGTKDFETPNDANTDNAYVVNVRATDTSNNTTDQTITVTVTDVVEGTFARYWRLNVTSTNANNSMNVAEVQLRSTAGGADQTGSGTASSPQGNLTNTPAAAFDNDAATTWHSAIGSLPGAVQLVYDFGSGVTKEILQVVIQAHPSNAAYSPLAFSVQWSTDNSAWTTSWSVTTPDTWTGGEIRTFTKP
jgi:ribosomal protein S11